NEVRSGRSTLERFYSTLSLIPDERTYRLRDIATRKPIGVLDERFVVTRVLAEPDHLFLLHGRTWKVVEFREGELLVEGVREIIRSTGSLDYSEERIRSLSGRAYRRVDRSRNLRAEGRALLREIGRKLVDRTT
ncbi:MAG: hypothetical protein L3K09_06360, partial [Thermoplasmata archaeon]|nr:hypothetical protein [Thermoplasmata archaeon]